MNEQVSFDKLAGTPLIEDKAPLSANRIGHQLHRWRWFLLFVIVPVICGVVYYCFLASDIYVSESRFVIKAPGEKQSQLSSLASIIQTTGLSSGQEQTNEVLAYVRSRNALEDLERRTDVRARFADRGADFLSRFPLPWHRNSFENLYRYYGNMVSARLDPDTGTAVLTVKAFNPQDAQNLNGWLLQSSEALVNRLNERAQRKGVAEAQRVVTEAEARVRNARVALRTYRNSEALLDPTQQAIGVLQVSNTLIQQQASLKAELEQMQRLTPANPTIPALQRRITAIGNQIAQQAGRAVGTTGGIASKLGQYEALTAEQEFATKMLAAADASLEQARVEAQKQQFYLERIVEPNRPDMALYPKRFQQILTIAGTGLCLYLVGWMLITGILEHAPED